MSDKSDELRRINLYILRDIAGGTTAALAKMLDLNRGTLSTLLNGREITDLLATRIESAAKKPFGWLSTEQDVEQFPVYDTELVGLVFEKIHGHKGLLRAFTSSSAAEMAERFDMIYDICADPETRDTSLKVLFKLGGDNAAKNTGKNSPAKKKS